MEPTPPAETPAKNRYRWLDTAALAAARALAEASWLRHRDAMETATADIAGIAAMSEIIASPLVEKARTARDGALWKAEIRLVAGGTFSASDVLLAHAAQRCAISAGVWSGS